MGPCDNCSGRGTVSCGKEKSYSSSGHSHTHTCKYEEHAREFSIRGKRGYARCGRCKGHGVKCMKCGGSGKGVEGESWFDLWVSNIFRQIQDMGERGATMIWLVGILPEPGKNFITAQEWPVLIERYEKLMMQPRFANLPMKTKRCDVAELDATVTNLGEKEYLILASCPGQHMDSAAAAIHKRETARCVFSSVDDSTDCALGRT